MKKKIIATALALCLVLGLLPMSALAAQYKGTLNGNEITFNVDDTTGKVTLPDAYAHYTVAPDTLTVGQFPKTTTFSLSHYAAAPETITVDVTLVEEPTEQTFTVSFAPGEHATGTKEAVSLTVPEGENSVAYTLPNAEGFTPESGYIFAGWLVGDAPDTQEAGAEITVTADVTLTAQWTPDETILVTKPSVNNGAVTVDSLDVTAKTEAVILDLQGDTTSGATVTINATIVAKVKENDVKTVEVKSTLATVTLPVAALPTGKDAELKVEKAEKAAGAPSAVTVSASVSVTLTGVTSNTVLAAPISITVDVSSAPANAMLAYWNAGRNAYVRARGTLSGGKATFLTRHLTDFAVVSEAEPEVLTGVTSTINSASANVEPGETGMFLFKVQDGDGWKSGVAYGTAGSVGEAVVSVGGGVEGATGFDRAYALTKKPANVFSIDPADIMAEGK